MRHLSRREKGKTLMKNIHKKINAVVSEFLAIQEKS